MRPRLGQPISAITIGLPGEGLLQAAELRERIVDGGLDVHALPVRQEVHGDEIHVLGEIGVRQPHVPGLGGADRLADGVARLIEILLELLDGNVAAQNDLVADDHPHDIDMSAGELDGGFELGLVGVAVIVDPGADGDVDAVALGELRNIRQRAEVTVSPDSESLAFQELEVLVDLGIRRHFLMRGVLADAERGEREALNPGRPRRLQRRTVEERPEREGQRWRTLPRSTGRVSSSWTYHLLAESRPGRAACGAFSEHI